MALFGLILFMRLALDCSGLEVNCLLFEFWSRLLLDDLA